MQFNSLIPELTVSDIAVSKAFYLGVLGFMLEYERPEEGFAFVSLEEAQLMLEQYHETGWNTAVLQRPFGRGINLSIDTPAIDDIYARVQAACHPLYRPMTSYYPMAKSKMILEIFYLPLLIKEIMLQVVFFYIPLTIFYYKF